jgi:hypothetical protein
MKPFRILLLAATAATAGCVAQEGTPGAGQPGLPPVAIADIVSVETDSLNNSIAALTNDIDLSGTGLTITAVMVDQTLPPMAGAAASTNGTTVTFSPPAGFIGVVTLQYAIEDGTGAVSSALIAVSVLPVALPPVALPDTAMVLQDAAATDIDVLANDVDFSGGGLALTNVSVATSLPPAAHTLAIVADQVRFTPAAAFVGVVVVNYTATDGNGETADGVLTIVVSPLAVPTGPVPVPDAEVVAQDSGATDIDVLANDVDPVGGGLSVTGVVVSASVPNAVHTVAIAGNQVRFTPAAGFAGIVVVTYTATDDDGNDADGVLTVVVSPLALAVGPVPIPDAVVVMQDSAATDIDVLANDVDLAGGGLTLSAPTVTASEPAAAHTLAVVGNQVRFTPAAGFAGIVVVTYTATDVEGDSANGVLNIVVSPLDLPVGLVAIPDAAIVAQDSVDNDIDVLANDVDFAGGGLTLTNVSVFSSLPVETTGHTVSISADQVRFTPEAGFAGVVQVEYTATDVNGLTSSGLLNITVSPTPLVLGPVAVPDTAIVSSSGGAVLIDVVGNDLDPAGGGLTLTAIGTVIEVPPGSGAFAIVGNQVEYTPTPLYLGAVLVPYTVTDINGNTSDGELSLTVAP